MKIVLEFKRKPYRMVHLEKVVNNYRRAVIRAARKELLTQGKNASGRLSKNIRLDVSVDKFDIIIYPTSEKAPYWVYVDQGVRGFLSDRKAPDSPFKFGSGTGPKGKLVPSIDKWTIVKPVMDVRDEQGRFIPRKSLVRMIARSVYLYGLETTNFITTPMNVKWDNYIERATEALVKDMTPVYEDIIPDFFDIKIGRL